jgi:hypothetical protein
LEHSWDHTPRRLPGPVLPLQSCSVAVTGGRDYVLTGKSQCFICSSSKKDHMTLVVFVQKTSNPQGQVLAVAGHSLQLASQEMVTGRKGGLM